MRNNIINDDAVQDRLSENYLMRNFITQNILDMKYLKFMVLLASYRRRLCIQQEGKSFNNFAGALTKQGRERSLIKFQKLIWKSFGDYVGSILY